MLCTRINNSNYNFSPFSILGGYMKYKLLRANEPKCLEKLCNKYIEKGYALYGPPFSTREYVDECPDDLIEYSVYCQGMIKP